MREEEYYQTAWWFVLLRGIVSILFGLVALMWPGITFVVLVKVIAVFLMIDGIIAIVSGLFGIGKMKGWFLTVLLGILAIMVGVFILNNAAVTGALLVVILGLWIIVKGIFDLISMFFIEGDFSDRLLLLILGIVEVLFGLIIVFSPLMSAAVLTWLIGLYALIMGPVMIAVSIDMKSKAKK